MNTSNYTNRCVRSQSSIACVQHVRYTAAKPRGPVRRNTMNTAFATPTVKRGFVMPKFSGPVRLHASVQWLRGMVGATRKAARTAVFVFLTTMLHLLRVETQTVVP